MGDAGFYVTGPACIDESINQCSLTSTGTRGHTGSSVHTPATTRQPTVTTTVAPDPVATTTQVPTYTCVPVASCEGLPWCDWSVFSTWCREQAEAGACPATWCRKDVKQQTSSVHTCKPMAKCDGLPWCDWPVYVAWCEVQTDGCPKPWCTEDGEQPTSTSPVQTTTVSSAGCGNGAWMQCGGRDFIGDTCCQAGMTCVASGEWWSSCQPASFVQNSVKPSLRKPGAQRAALTVDNYGVALIHISSLLSKTPQPATENEDGAIGKLEF